MPHSKKDTSCSNINLSKYYYRLICLTIFAFDRIILTIKSFWPEETPQGDAVHFQSGLIDDIHIYDLAVRP